MDRGRRKSSLTLHQRHSGIARGMGLGFDLELSGTPAEGTRLSRKRKATGPPEPAEPVIASVQYVSDYTAFSCTDKLRVIAINKAEALMYFKVCIRVGKFVKYKLHIVCGN